MSESETMMSESINVLRVDLGIVDGCQVWEVRNADTGQVIGSDRELPDPEPTPDELARESALAKLQALGLTEAEAMALAGN
jgi:hypothetical protein